MSDVINAKGSDAKYQAHPEGQFIAVCVDAIDLGDKLEQFADQPAKLSHKCALVFRTGERNGNGDYIDIAREFTVSMNEKSNLRKFLEQWRGKPYQREQIEEGVPLHKLEGQPALLTISHNVSAKGRTYANITACVGVPKQMRGSLPETEGYARADYWRDRKNEYADSARKFRAEQAVSNDSTDRSEEFEDFDETQQFANEQDLPF